MRTLKVRFASVGEGVVMMSIVLCASDMQCEAVEVTVCCHVVDVGPVVQALIGRYLR